MYIFPADSPEGDIGQLHDAGQDILDDVGGFEWVSDAIKKNSIDHQAHVVLRVDCLFVHVDHTGLKGYRLYLLYEWSVIVQPWLTYFLEFPEVLHHADC